MEDVSHQLMSTAGRPPNLAIYLVILFSRICQRGPTQVPPISVSVSCLADDIRASYSILTSPPTPPAVPFPSGKWVATPLHTYALFWSAPSAVKSVRAQHSTDAPRLVCLSIIPPYASHNCSRAQTNLARKPLTS